ncbi:hypothetical protein D3C86_2178330 [compost metagenome]
MTQSPMYLSIVPRFPRIRSVNRLNTLLSNACSCVGSMVSDILVKPRMSQNMTVNSLVVAFML